MKALKFSRQRESIRECLKNRKDHPTADAVYVTISKDYPKISLGTVYRNLNLLADMGEVIKITTPHGGDRFDGVTKPHYHVLCTECGEIIDLNMDIVHSINEQAEKCFDGSIHSHTALFYGTCRVCLKKKKSI